VTSSILNSDPAEPRWGYVWVVAILLVAIVVGSWELLVRNAGLGPGYVDNKVLWADTRHQLNNAGDDAIVLLGASRMQRAVDVSTMSDRFGRPVLQLSIEGSSYLPLLENLAVDPRIAGTVVVSIAPAFTFNRLLSQIDEGRQSLYLDYYSNQSYARRLEQQLTLSLQGRAAFRALGARPTTAIPNMIETGEMPGLDHKTIFRNRVVHMNYDLMPDIQTDGKIAALYLENSAPYSKEEFDSVVNYIATIAAMLRQKGVDVFFLRLPSGGVVRTVEEALFPREQFWSVLEQNVGATFVHFADYPELEGFLSQDGSHMDSSKIVEFTRQLNSVLARNRLQPDVD